MNSNLLYLIPFMAISGCNAVSQNLTEANNTVQDAVYNVGGRMQQWTDPEGIRASARPSPQTGFCYQSLGDIVCYDAPQPNMSNTLFGYQGYTAPAQSRGQASLAPENAVVMGGASRMTVSEIRPVRRTPVPAIDPEIFPLSQPYGSALHGHFPVQVKASVPQVAANEMPLIEKSGKDARPLEDPQPLMPRF